MSDEQKRKSFLKRQKDTNTSKMPAQEHNDSEVATQAILEVPSIEAPIKKKQRKPRQRRLETTGPKLDVWNGKVDKTPGGLTKADLVWHPVKNMPVSKRKQAVGKKNYLEKKNKDDENDPMRPFWDKKKRASKSGEESPKESESPKETELQKEEEESAQTVL